MKYNRVIISVLVTAALTVSSGCSSGFFEKKSKPSATGAKQTLYAPELDPEVHELITDQRFKSLESDKPVRFETAVTPEEAANGVPVELRDSSGKKLSAMYDDGSNGDRIAGDGIYTCSYQPKPDGETSYSYTASIDGVETKPTEVRYFDKITEQDYSEMEQINQSFSNIQEKYLDGQGNIPADKKGEAIDRMSEYAQQLCDEGKAVEYRVNKKYDNVVVKLSSGITCMYSLPSTYNMSGGSGKTLSPSMAPKMIEAIPRTYAVNKMTVNVFQPFFGGFTYISDGSGLTEELETKDDYLARLICSEFPEDASLGGLKKRDDVSYESVKDFGEKQVIIWDGHGGYDPEELHSTICTSIEYNESDFDGTDLIDDKMIINSITQDSVGGGIAETKNYVAFTYKYIDNYCPDLTDSLLILGMCFGARDSVLATSFLKKNCNVILGFTNETLAEYIQCILNSVITQMCTKQINVQTGYPAPYCSINEALSKAKSEYGKTDSLYANTASGYHESIVRQYEDGFIDKIYQYDDLNADGEPTPSEPILLGNRNYRFADVITDTVSEPATPSISANGSLQLSQEILYVDVNETKSFTVSSRPTDCTSLTWSINDNNIAAIDQNGNVTGNSTGTTWGCVESNNGAYYKYFTVVVN